MRKIMQYAGQAMIYVGLMFVIGFFADTPTYRHMDPDKALIRLSFVHSGNAKGGCHKRTKKELSKLAPNMRMKTICPRKRLPLLVELDVDGKRIYKHILPPTGVRSTGPSMVYKAFPIATGDHKITVLMRDSERKEGYDYITKKEITLKPAQNLVIQFRAEDGEFTFK
jgi:hypothetical protein